MKTSASLHVDPPAPVRAVPPALEIRGLRKVYGGSPALRGVALTVAPGEIHGLLGENGAGKSTLVRTLAGVEARDGGTIAVFGTALADNHRPADVHALGVAFIHQDLGLIGELSVAENIALTAGYAQRRGLIDWRFTRRRAEKGLARLGESISVDAIVAELPLAKQAVVAIARALALDARLVVLDEPTASLSAAEARALFEILARLRAEGVACILITHRTDEVMRLCDAVTVLRDGEVVATRPTSGLTTRQLVELIIGHAPQGHARRAAAVNGRSLLALRDVTGEAFGPVSLDVRAGEIYGVTGLASARHHQLGEILFGLARLTHGSILLDGRPYAPRNPAHAIRRGIGYVPGDRAALGLAVDLTARENLFLNPAARAASILRIRSERRAARALMTRFDVKPSQPEVAISTLSGGNAQKVVLAKWLDAAPSLIVLSEPTLGVDVGAREQIYGKLREACTRSAGVVLISSDPEEIADVCDRAMVLVHGRVGHVLEGEELSVARITGAFYGRL